MKDYQNSDMDAGIPVRASVSVAMDDVAATMREGLLALAVGAGLQVTVGDLLVEESDKFIQLACVAHQSFDHSRAGRADRCAVPPSTAGRACAYIFKSD